MSSYSSDKFYRDWRYAIEKDFVNPDGKPFEYAENGKQAWGEELKCLKFDEAPTSAVISDKGKHLAVAVGEDIHVFNSPFDAAVKPLRILRGHMSTIESIAFKPGDANILVSSAANRSVGTLPEGSIIVFWDLSAENSNSPNPSKDEITRVSNHAARAATEYLTDLASPLKLRRAEQEFLATSFKPFVSQAIARNNASEKERIVGRLQSNFQSNVFSPSGKYMMYLPGEAPPSNGDEPWDINIYSTEEHKNVLTLVGHRDALMWMGYNADETLIGTVSWDQTMKIWDAKTGKVIHTFETTGQNWSGGFSPDSKMFAGTWADGSVHVYSLDDGTEYRRADVSEGWSRALAWSPDSSMLTAGGEGLGKVILIDIKSKAVVQERVLSTARVKLKHEELRSMLAGFLEIYNLKFVDGGKKIVHFTSGDGSAEVYDLTTYRKWRFAREGTDSYPPSEGVAKDADDEEETDEVTSKGGFDMEVWEDSENGRVMIATVDGDAVTIWSV